MFWVVVGVVGGGNGGGGDEGDRRTKTRSQTELEKHYAENTEGFLY